MHFYEKEGSVSIHNSNLQFLATEIYKRRSSRREVFCKKGVLRNFTKFTEKHLCQSLFFNKVAGPRMETLAQVFSCDFCEISKNTFFSRTPLVAASVKARKGISSPIIAELFKQKNKNHYNLRQNSQFTIPAVNSVYRATESLENQYGWKRLET